MNTTQVGLFGGSFDPIHHGHLIVARAVAEQLGLDAVLFLPSARPPHKDASSLQDARHRGRMVELAIAGEPGFRFSDIDLTRQGPSYTIETVDYFQRTLPQAQRLVWIVGADSLPELPLWHRSGELLDRCTIATAVRPGWEDVDWADLGRAFTAAQIARLRENVCPTPRIDISSTDIRLRVCGGKSIRYLVPEAVRSYIEEHGLYRE